MGLGLLIQAGVAASLVRRLKRSRHGKHPEFTPRLTILLAVRGNDPSLEACLQGLLNQEYPDYHIVAVVDSADDPGCRPLAEFQRLAPPGRLETIVITRQRSTCGGTANALIAGIS